MKVLLYSSLFPNSVQPSHGIFVENRLRQLRATYGDIDVRVVAPVPWFPIKHERFGQYARFSQVAATETRYGVEVRYPRYPVIPKVGMSVAPLLMYLWTRRAVRKLWNEGFRFDLIDAHYFYPDGVAAAMLAWEFDRPFLVTGRGTDLNLIPRYAIPRRQIQWLAGRADHMIFVADALRQYLRDMGVDLERTTVLRNGVDLEQFTPGCDRDSLRAELALKGPQLLSVGHLIERKGHHLVIEALAELPGHSLVIAGDGPEQKTLENLAVSLGLADRIRFTGRLATAELVRYYRACDALVLASSREGWANVLLESMACGTPVVATAVDGTPEVVAADEAGVLVHERTAAALAAGVRQLFAGLPAREATRRYAEQFGWDATSHGQRRLFERVIAEHAGGDE